MFAYAPLLLLPKPTMAILGLQEEQQSLKYMAGGGQAELEYCRVYESDLADLQSPNPFQPKANQLA